MITDVFTSLGDVATGMLDVLTNIFSGVVDIFYTTSGETGSFTFLGYALLIGVGTPLVFWGLNWLVGIFRRMLRR